MSTPNRTALLNKTQRVLKRTYKVTPPRSDQPLLETLLFACCLENAHFDEATDALAKVQNSFFDWNEIRVSTIKELAETFSGLRDANGAAARLKNVLQAVFETDYSFDLEHLKKQNLGTAIKRLQKLPGATPFGVAYATQVSLGGHAIPLDEGTLGAMVVLGLATEADAEKGVVPGLERAISKSKGREFGGLIHELGADFFASPHSPAVKKLLLSIAPDAKDRFPKRRSKKQAAAAEEPEPAEAESTDKKKKKAPAAAKKAATKKATSKKATKRTSRAAKSTVRTKSKVKKRPKKAAAKSLSKRKPR